MSRQAAWACLRSGNPAPLREVEAFAGERELDARDTALVRRLVGMELRHRGTLRALVRTFAHKNLKADLCAHLHLGLVQLLYFDRIPEHAAVSETCRAVMYTVGSSKVAIVNGILRNVLRSLNRKKLGDPRHDLVDRNLSFARPVFRDPEEHPLLWMEDALSLPAALGKRWTRRHGHERARALARAFLDEPPLVLRVPLTTEGAREEVLAELSRAGVDARAGDAPDVIVCPTEATSEVLASEAFGAGRATVQGATAAAAARLLEPKEGERLLDLCAGPGGKTAILAEHGASVVATDVNPERLARVEATCARLGVRERVELVESDGARAVAPGLFDGVLVDAPCSNTGVLGARPGARWRFGPKTLASLVDLQTRLLAEGAERTRPGGRLVWSTCSLEPEENEQLVRAFIAENPEWSLEREEARLPDRVKGPWDGGYAARLVRGPE